MVILDKNWQFSENGLVGIREPISSNAAAMETWGGRVDNVSELWILCGLLPLWREEGE